MIAEIIMLRKDFTSSVVLSVEARSFLQKRMEYNNYDCDHKKNYSMSILQFKITSRYYKWHVKLCDLQDDKLEQKKLNGVIYFVSVYRVSHEDIMQRQGSHQVTFFSTSFPIQKFSL